VTDDPVDLPTHRRELRWTAADLDRCVHGRHSIDDCYGCPGALSTGNLFLASADRELTRGTTTRIGTTYDGRAIVVTPIRHPR
jgi:hypothetical protein